MQQQNFAERPTRQRLRAKPMADELDISQRKLAQLRAMGCPYTAIGNLVWFEPERVHAWLDKFTRAGKPGVKRVKDQKVAQKVAESVP